MRWIEGEGREGDLAFCQQFQKCIVRRFVNPTLFEMRRQPRSGPSKPNHQHIRISSHNTQPDRMKNSRRYFEQDNLPPAVPKEREEREEEEEEEDGDSDTDESTNTEEEVGYFHITGHW